MSSFERNAIAMVVVLSTLWAAGLAAAYLWRNETSVVIHDSDSAPVPQLSLEMSSADSQGGIGHILTMALLNELAARGLPDRVAYVLTHTVVGEDDPAFRQPTKPMTIARSASWPHVGHVHAVAPTPHHRHRGGSSDAPRASGPAHRSQRAVVRQFAHASAGK